MSRSPGCLSLFLMCSPLPPSLLHYIFSLPLEHIFRDVPTKLAPTPTSPVQLSTFPPVLLVGFGAFALVSAFLLRGNRKEIPNAALSEQTVLRIHALTARQPYRMPDSGDDPDTFPALPFSSSPKKQSLFIFWLFVLLLLAGLLYAFRAAWVATLASYVTEKRNSLSWTLTVVVSVALAKIAAPFTRFVLAVVPIVGAGLQWTKYTVLLSMQPATFLRDMYMWTTYLLHRLLPGLPLQTQVDKLFSFVSSILTVLGGYRLAAARVARTHTLALRWATRSLEVYTTIQTAPYLPLVHFRTWGWTTIKHVLVFSLEGTSWNSISPQKFSVMLAPALVLVLYEIYRYCTHIPPRSPFEIALDPIRLALDQQKATLDRQQILFQRLAVEQADFKLALMQNLDKQFATLSTNLAVAALPPG
ncbi:hypothetical protein C8F01DRAFT_714354 [Mycena amicta]|nr:hypothetical protein C8F01DRAFT_714354 [Mycena amicta]